MNKRLEIFKKICLIKDSFLISKFSFVSELISVIQKYYHKDDKNVLISVIVNYTTSNILIDDFIESHIYDLLKDKEIYLYYLSLVNNWSISKQYSINEIEIVLSVMTLDKLDRQFIMVLFNNILNKDQKFNEYFNLIKQEYCE